MKKIFSFICLAYLLFPSLSNAQEKIATSYESFDGVITVTYELSGDSQKEYDISLTLKRTGLASFQLAPLSLTGDIGKGYYASGKRHIIWNLTNAEMEKLDADDYYFEIHATEIKSGHSWYYYVGGAALAGGAAAVLLKKNTPAAAETSFPAPVGRPQ